jgi:uncharacterized membrane protein
MEQLTFSQRLSDKVTAFCGSWTFITFFSALVIVWVILNSAFLYNYLFGEFDPYPYIFLNLILTIVSTFQGPLIMMSQNRQAERDRATVHDLHAKLDRILEDIEGKK